MAHLRAALVCNAAFSLLTGVIVLFFSEEVASLLRFEYLLLLKVLGVGLLLHAGALAWVLSRPDIGDLARLNVWFIAPYPVLVAALLLSGKISGAAGIGIATFDAAAVGLLAIWQFRALPAL